MSMYWSGGTELGCVLTGQDIKFFEKSYIERNQDEFPDMSEEDAMSAIEEWLACSQLPTA